MSSIFRRRRRKKSCFYLFSRAHIYPGTYLKTPSVSKQSPATFMYLIDESWGGRGYNNLPEPKLSLIFSKGTIEEHTQHTTFDRKQG